MGCFGINGPDLTLAVFCPKAMTKPVNLTINISNRRTHLGISFKTTVVKTLDLTKLQKCLLHMNYTITTSAALNGTCDRG